jgi:putative membrane protein
MTSIRSISLGLALVLSLAACEKQDDRSAAAPGQWPESAPQPMPEETQPASMPPAAAAGPAAAEPAPANPQTPEAAPLTDAQIFMVLDAANDKEIEESKVVTPTTKNKDVKSFADMMVKHHGEAKTKGQKLAEKLGVTPATSPDAKKITEETKTEVDKLKKLAGADLDKAYIDLMVTDHQTVLDTIDKKLIPAAKNADLKKMIESDLRPTVETHLKKAQELQKKMGAKQPSAAP